MGVRALPDGCVAVRLQILGGDGGRLNQEAGRTLQATLKRTPAAGFTLCNPTQRRRREWTAIDWNCRKAPA